MKGRGQSQKSPGKCRLFLVEDHPVTQQGLALLLNLEADLQVCGKAGTVDKALTEIAATQPNLVIVDIALPGRDGIELIKDLATFHPQLPTLVLSTLDEAIYAERALRAGAKGYIMKQEPVELLLEAVHHVLAGEVYLSEAMRNNLFQKSLSRASKAGTVSIEGLSDRELEVFRLIGEGCGTRQIAADLGVSVSTVETHRTNIKKKLGAKRAPDLVRQAVEWLHRQNSSPRP
jgi:DNA-binding NarL/FixJ family response regulator